jgi:hypothetical protein
VKSAGLARFTALWNDGGMPKDRKLTYSDRQAQAARDKKQSVQKKISGEASSPSPAPTAPKKKEKR